MSRSRNGAFLLHNRNGVPERYSKMFLALIQKSKESLPQSQISAVYGSACPSSISSSQSRVRRPALAKWQGIYQPHVTTPKWHGCSWSFRFGKLSFGVFGGQLEYLYFYSVFPEYFIKICTWFQIGLWFSNFKAMQTTLRLIHNSLC